MSIAREQLDEIKKLARDPKSAAFHDCMARQTIPLVEALKEAWEALDEREGDMHARIRAGYDKTVADSWRAHCAKVEKERDEARSEVKRLKAERDEARKWLEGICSEFEGAVAHADWRAAGSKGMSVPFTGDFASVVQLPGAINRMRWWAKVFRAVLKGEQP